MHNKDFFEAAKTQNPDIWSAALTDVAADTSKLHDLATEVSIAFSRLTMADPGPARVNMWGEHVAQETLKYNLEKYIFDGLTAHLREVRPCHYCKAYQSRHCPDCSGGAWIATPEPPIEL